MRVYAGTFDEELAERVAGDLKKAGVRTELRRALEIDVDGAYYMEGALSTLKEQYAGTELHDVVLEWETNLEHARSVMKDGITENEFEEGVLDLVMPERARTKEFRKMLEEQLMKGELQIPDDDEKVEEFNIQIIKEMHFIWDLSHILELNGIRYENGAVFGKLPEDPYVRVKMDIPAERAEELGLKFLLDIAIDMQVAVYAHAMDILYERDKLEKLCDEKPHYIELMVFADVVNMMLDKIEDKMETRTFIENVEVFAEEGNKIAIQENAVYEILRMLEKAEIVKIKKGKISLRKQK